MEETPQLNSDGDDRKPQTNVEEEPFETPSVPYDASRIAIERKTQTVYGLMERIRNGELDLFPPFQRSPHVWKQERQSRLIESLILNIPLPVFYMTEDAQPRELRYTWHVVDGLQRLCAMRIFILGDGGKFLRLRGLEYLEKQEGRTFAELPPSFRRNILEAELQIYVIKPDTPDELKFNIFRRVNTGGVPLTQQEIRHAMHQRGGAGFLKELAELEAFVEATSNVIKPDRMADREFVNRFLAFYLQEVSGYRGMDSFMNSALTILDECPSARKEFIKNQFAAALKYLHQGLGEDAFRRFDPREGKSNTALNKALFEVFTVTAAKHLDAAERMARVPERAVMEYRSLFKDESEQGLGSIVRTSTGHLSNIQMRYKITERYFDLF